MRAWARIASRGEEVIGLGEGRVGGGDLVTVDAVEEPDRDRERLDQVLALRRSGAPRVGEFLEPGLDGVQPGHPIGRANDEDPQRPALPGARVLDEPRALGRRRGQRLQVRGDVLGRGDLVSMVVTQDLSDGGDLRVVGGGGVENARRVQGEAESKGGKHHE